MRKILALILAVFLAFSCPLPAFGQTPGARLRVFYAGPDGGVATALGLAEDFEIVQDPAQADALVLNGAIPPAAAERYHAGAGLVLILGPDLTSAQVSDLLGQPVQLTAADAPASLIESRGKTLPSHLIHPVTTDVLWNSAPQVRERFVVGQVPGGGALVHNFDNGEWLLWTVPPSAPDRETYVFNAFLDGANPQIQEWAYFNYLIYNMVKRAGGQEPLSFAAYPASPVPHARDRQFILFSMAGLLLMAAGTFIAVRRYSKAHPEALDMLVSRPVVYEQRQAKTEWEEVGFHRPLGGFMVAFMMGLILFIPLIIYQNLILPTYILPSAQALGIWGRVTQAFNLAWTIFDMGTSLAFVKFFSQYRVSDPRKAVQYGQVYVWWQVLSGAVQVALVTTIASSYLPETAYALYAWSVIIHTLIQIPGFYTVMKSAFSGWQRFDYATALEIGTSQVFPMLTQPIIVLAMAAWGRGSPVFGPAMGGLLGLGLAAYATEALNFLVGMLLYRRLGYNARLLFMAHFDWNTVKSAFRFGVFDMLASGAWAAGQFFEILITQTRLVNSTEVWGNWVMAQNFVFGFSVTATLYNNLMPSISEAISNAYKKLSTYYSVMAYKWGGLVNGFIGAVLLAVTDRFILGATGPEFTRAAAFSIPLLIWGAIQYPSWVGDSVQNGSGKPHLKMIMVASEQVVRVALAFLLIRPFQIYALIIAYFAGLLVKGIGAYFVNHKLCFPQRFYFWQSLGAPLLAGAAHYAILRWVTGFIWQGDQVTSILIFLIGILFSFPLYAFLYGLAGGWDDATLDELRQATALSSFMRPFSWLFWKCTALGARVSPLHGRFPIDIRAEAMQEAAQLTRIRVKVAGDGAREQD